MRIISYNIHACTQQKVDLLFSIEADVYVVPEIACPTEIALPVGFDMKWNGNYITKGLGVIWKTGLGYIPDWYEPNLNYAIPLVAGDFLVLGFWPTKIQKNEMYTKIARSMLEYYSNYIKKYKTIITGDFNLYHKLSRVNKVADILSINEFLNSLGLSSVYHAKTGESFGAESQATYFHQFKKESPFFLDYTYSNFPIPLEAYRLLDWEKKFSDHVGQVIEI